MPIYLTVYMFPCWESIEDWTQSPLLRKIFSWSRIVWDLLTKNKFFFIPRVCVCGCVFVNKSWDFKHIHACTHTHMHTHTHAHLYIQRENINNMSAIVLLMSEDFIEIVFPVYLLRIKGLYSQQWHILKSTAILTIDSNYISTVWFLTSISKHPW